MSEISRQHEQLVQDTLADKIRQETDAAKIQLLKESLIGREATTVLPPKGAGWKSDYPVYLRKSPGSRQDINGIKPGAKLTILDVAKETSDTKRGNGTSESHMWYKVEVVDSNDLNTKAYGNDNVGWVSAEFLHADTSHIHDIITPTEGTPATVAPGTEAPAAGGTVAPGTEAPAAGGTVAPGTEAPAEGGTVAPGTEAPAEGGTNKETGPIFTRRNGETVLPWLVGPDGKTADFTQIQKEFEEMVTQKTQEIQENPTTKKANLVSDVVDIWISQARSEGANVSDVETKQNSFNEAVNTLDGTPEKYTNLETAISELFASMQKVEKNDKEIIDDEELTKIEQIVNGVNSSTNIDEKRREIFSQMRSGFFDVDGASSGVAEKLTRTIMDNSPGNVEFTWLKGVLNDPGFIAELSISDTNRIKDYLEKAGLRGGDDAINTIIEKIKKVSEQRGEIEKDVRTYLEKEIENFDITNPTHKQYMDRVVEQSLGNQKKMIIEQEWMKFMIDTRPNFRNDPNINLLGGILGESAGWDMDIADENMGVMREIAITAALSAVPLGAGMAAARIAAVGGVRLVEATGMAVRLANFANKGKWAARAVKTGEFITASAVEGGAFHVAYGAAGNVEEWALNTVGIDIDIVGDTYWEPKEWMKSMAMVAVFKGLSTGLAQVRGADKIPFSDIRAMKMGTLAKGGKMATETIKRMVQEISKVPVLGYSVTLGGEASAIMLIGEVFEQGGFPNFEEMTMAEFVQAVIMVLMGRAAGRIIQPRPIGPKPEPKPDEPNGPKPEPKVETSPFMSAKERMTHVKPGETVLVTGKDGATMEITVKANNNGILEGTAKSKEADGTINPEIPVKMNIRSDGLLVVKNMDGTPYKGLVIKKLSDIAEIEVQPAGNKTKEKPKTEEPAPKEKFTATEKAADHGKMRELEGQISGVDKQIAAAERLGNKNTKTRELIRLNEQKTALVKELDGIRTKYQIPRHDRAPNLATNLTLNEFSVGVEKTVPKGKTEKPGDKEEPKTETKSEKELPFMSAQERIAHVQIGETVVIRRSDGTRLKFLAEKNTNGVVQGKPLREGKIVGSTTQYEISNGELKVTSKELGTYTEKLSNITEIEVQPAKKVAPEKPKELTEGQRLQKENAEANTEFDRLVNSSVSIEPKVLEAALAKKRATAEALQKFLSPDTAAKTPEAKTPLTPEQIKSGKALAEQIKKFTRGEGPYKTVLGDNGPNHMDIGGNMQITRHVEGGKFGIGRKETFSIQEKGSKTIGEKFTAEELTSRLTGEQQTQLAKVMDSIAKAEIHSRGNTTETFWTIDGTTYVKVVQKGFVGGADGTQRFEGIREGNVYTGTLTRADGRVLEGAFKITEPTKNNETLGEFFDRNHLDMVNA